MQKEAEKIISDTKTEYNLALTEINIKETLLVYLKNENHTKKHSISNESEETKPHKKLEKRLNQNGKNYYHFFFKNII